eukprot:873585-Prorocentrum_minimum.AAC.1
MRPPLTRLAPPLHSGAYRAAHVRSSGGAVEAELAGQQEQTEPTAPAEVISPVTAPQQEYTPPPDQSQPLNRNIPLRRTSRSPSVGIYPAAGPLAHDSQILRRWLSLRYQYGPSLSR